MYQGFLWHSPRLAHAAQSPFLSVHPEKKNHRNQQAISEFPCGKNCFRMCVKARTDEDQTDTRFQIPMDNRYSEKADEFQRPPQKKGY